jgi:4-hydroxybenzoate polyprenyltransferase
MAEEITPKKPVKYRFFVKFLCHLSVVRGYNILIMVMAQYLAAIFIFAPERSLKDVLLDLDLYLIVVATVCSIASGYIINNFYDAKKDAINRPIKSKIDNLVGQNTKLNIYFLLNFIAVLCGFIVSWRAALFFAVYIFLIWIYSHKFKKYPLTRLILASVLTLLPFFVIFIYFRNFSYIIFTHALFLFLVLMIKELMKDLENIKGDIAQNYLTIPIKYGEKFTKILTFILVIFTLDPIYFLWKYPEMGLMKYYFYFTGIVFIVFLFLLWKANSKRDYLILHNLIKLIIVVGVLSLVLIDTSVIIQKLLQPL